MIRVVTWNVLAQCFVSAHADECVSPYMQKENRVQRIREAIKNVDVAMLQEVDFFGELQTALRDDGFRYSAWSHRTHEHGVCIFSKIPITAVSAYSFYVVATLANSIHVASVHLKSKPDGEDKRCQQVSSMLENHHKLFYNSKIIVGGDWNAAPGNTCHELMIDDDYKEITTGLTTRKLRDGVEVARTSDYVWVRGMDIVPPPRPDPVQLLPNHECPSDHLPVFRNVHMPK